MRNTLYAGIASLMLLGCATPRATPEKILIGKYQHAAHELAQNTNTFERLPSWKDPSFFIGLDEWIEAKKKDSPEYCAQIRRRNELSLRIKLLYHELKDPNETNMIEELDYKRNKRELEQYKD